MADLLSVKQRSAFNRALKNNELLPLLYGKVKELYWFDEFQEAGLFEAVKNPTANKNKDEKSISINDWSIVEYLVNSSLELKDKKNEGYAKKYLSLIREVPHYAIENSPGNYRTWWQFSKIILNIPSHLIEEGDFKLFDYWLSDNYERGLVAETLGCTWLSSLLNEEEPYSNELAEKLLKILFKVNIEEKKYSSFVDKQANFRFEDWYAKKIIERNASLVGMKLGESGINIFRDCLISTVDGLDNDCFSTMWQPAIEDHKQNEHKDNAVNLLVKAYRDSLLSFINDNSDVAKLYVEEMLQSNLFIIIRIAVYSISHEYSLLKNVVDKLLDIKYFNINVRHEIWHFLHSNYSNLTELQKQKVTSIIDGIQSFDDDDILDTGRTAYDKTIWLSAIKDTGDAELEEYRKNVKIVGSEPEHPDFSYYMSVGWGRPESPVPQEDLSILSIPELIELLKNYKDTGGFREPNIEGLVKTLKQLIKEKPNNYYNELNKFIDLDIAYVHEIIEAFRELWAEKSKLSWDDIWPKLLGFCLNVIKKERFWSIENSQSRDKFIANRYWVVSDIGRLLKAGTTSDDHAFGVDNLKQAEEIVGILLKNEKGEEFSIDSDAVSVSINSPRGHSLEALINIALRSCRISDKNNDKDHIEVWAHFKPIFELELDRSDGDNPEYEFITLVTNYLPNFLYMSTDWTLSNLNRIFDKDNDLKWLCAMQGYSYVNTIYPEIYQYMKDNGDFIKALDHGNLKDRMEDKIVQNIVIAYINEYENINDKDSLISILISRNNKDELDQLIWFLWTLRKNSNEKLVNKIYQLWPLILENLNTDDKEGKGIASKLCLWTRFITKVDDSNREWLHRIAPYADESFSSHDLLRSIAEISKTQPFEAYEIMMKMLERSFADYPDDAIKELLENLIKEGTDGQNKAKNIVKIYLKKQIRRPFNILNEILGIDQHV